MPENETETSVEQLAEMATQLRYFTLDDDHQLVEVPLKEWGKQFEDSDRRRVGLTEVDIGAGRVVKVSTVFLGFDHSFGGGPPLLFETMTFGDPCDQVLIARYSTWDQADAGHKKTVARLVAGLLPREE